MASPTSRTLEQLRGEGWDADVVERWVPHTRTRRDLLGVIDIVAVHEGAGILGVQATSGANMGSRIRKIQDSPRARTWLAAGGRLQVWGWRQLKPRPGRRRRWWPRVAVMRLVDGEIVSEIAGQRGAAHGETTTACHGVG